MGAGGWERARAPGAAGSFAEVRQPRPGDREFRAPPPGPGSGSCPTALPAPGRGGARGWEPQAHQVAVLSAAAHLAGCSFPKSRRVEGGGWSGRGPWPASPPSAAAGLAPHPPWSYLRTQWFRSRILLGRPVGGQVSLYMKRQPIPPHPPPSYRPSPPPNPGPRAPSSRVQTWMA